LQYNADYNQYVAFFLKMGNDLQQLCKYPTYIFVGKIKPHIKDIANHLKDAQNYTAEIAVKQFSAVVKEAVTDSAERINECIASATLPDLIRIENEIWEYRLLKGHVSQNADTFLVSAEQERLESAFLGKDYAKLKLLHEKINACMKVLKEKTFAASNMYSDGGEKHLRFAVRGDGEYDRYRIKYKEKIDSWRLGDGARSLASIVAIVNSRRLSDLDMLLTTAGIVYLKRHELIGSVKYSEVRHSEKNGQKIIMIGDNIEHDARDLNIDKFIELCGRLNTAVSDNSTNLLPEEIDKIFFPLPTSGVIYL
jgi:hypothetical protein